jgi:hypothetical protein
MVRSVVMSRPFVAAGLGALALAAGCASILSIPDRTAEWCDRPENHHDFCDDFDHVDAGSQWAGQQAMPGATLAFVPSSDTLPNALSLSTAPQALGTGTFAGLFQQFATSFGHVRFAVDVRFVSIDLDTEGGLAAQLGFLLVEQQDFCIGTVLTPAGIGIVMRAHTLDCTTVTNAPANLGTVTDDAGLTVFSPVAPVPPVNQWLHITLDVKRNDDGSGAVGFAMNYPGVIAAPQIPPGFLSASPPAVAVATSVVGPSGQVQLEFDNVTVDFPTD